MPARRDFSTPYQGDDFTHVLTILDANDQPINVAGDTFASQVRRRWSDTTIDATFSVDTSQAAVGQVTFTIAGPVLADFVPGRYRYDVQWVKAGRKLTLLAGEFVVTGEITR
jgi:hypothetical protein